MRGLYPYASGDLLAEPCWYMYTPFAGPDFLAAYAEQRQACLTALEEALLVAGPLPAQALRRLALAWPRLGQAAGPRLGEALAVPPPDPAGAGAAAARLAALDTKAPVATAALLEDLLPATASEPPSEAAILWLERLLARFETSRRLHEAYGPGLRGGRGEWRDLGPYADLALALGLGCPPAAGGTDLKLLNALLKLNDLLCSQASALAGLPVAAAATWAALGLERKAARRLMAAQGLA